MSRINTIKSGIEIRRFSGQRGNNKHCTRIIQGMMSAKNLTWIKGKNNEHDLFKKSNSGRYDADVCAILKRTSLKSINTLS